MIQVSRSIVLERFSGGGTFIRVGPWEAFIHPRGRSCGFPVDAQGERSFRLLGWTVDLSRRRS